MCVCTRSRLCEYLAQNDSISIQFYTSNGCIFWNDVTRRIKDRSLGMGVAGTRRNGRYRREGRTDILYHREERGSFV